jgi:hypothetical protein
MKSPFKFWRIELANDELAKIFIFGQFGKSWNAQKQFAQELQALPKSTTAAARGQCAKPNGAKAAAFRDGFA